MNKRPLAFLLVAVMAVSMFAAMPAAAQNNDCNAQATNTGDATNFNVLSVTGQQSASTSATAIVAPYQSSEQENEQENEESGSGGAFQLNIADQDNYANQNQC